MVGAMSSGMRQRLALFLAFLGEPRVVLLDEPFNWLDPVGAFDAKDCLTEIARTTLVITALHDVATFALRCGSGLMLQDGAIVRRFGASDLETGRDDLQGFERSIYQDLKMKFMSAAL
jgi:ABC-type multidrug transport system ATPase subunit